MSLRWILPGRLWYERWSWFLLPLQRTWFPSLPRTRHDRWMVDDNIGDDATDDMSVDDNNDDDDEMRDDRILHNTRVEWGRRRVAAGLLPEWKVDRDGTFRGKWRLDLALGVILMRFSKLRMNKNKKQNNIPYNDDSSDSDRVFQTTINLQTEGFSLRQVVLVVVCR